MQTGVSILTKNKDIKQRKKSREPLDLGELVHVLGERLKKKDDPSKLYKCSTENKPFFNKSQLFTIRKRVIFNNGSYDYWLSKRGKENIIDKRFIRQELFALRRQFI